MDKILKSASTVKIGKRFSNKRISLGLSLEETSKILFINEDYLNAIEEEIIVFFQVNLLPELILRNMHNI